MLTTRLNTKRIVLLAFVAAVAVNTSACLGKGKGKAPPPAPVVTKY